MNYSVESENKGNAITPDILDSLDICIYVTDLDTYEILFINRKMKERFANKDLVGATCWQALHKGFDQPCDFCPCLKLTADPSATIIWEEYDPVTHCYCKNHDRIIEWSDGRQVHIQHSVDITDIKKADAALQTQIVQQELLTAISIDFAGMDSFEDKINRTLNRIGTFIGVERAVIMKDDTVNKNLEFIFEWLKDPSTTDSILNKTISYDPRHPLYVDLTENSIVTIPDSNAIPNPPQNIWTMFGSQCLAGFAVKKAGVFWGYLMFDCYSYKRDWSFNEINLARTICGIISTAIEREEILLIAEQNSQVKADFLARMSHEIRTPMNAIIGMTSIAQNTSDLKSIQTCLSRIGDASKHLLAIINDILDMSKIEADKLELKFDDFNLENMLVEIFNIITVRADEKGQNMQINIAKNVPVNLRGDEFRISQIVTNLLSNAVKFTPEKGEIKMIISLVEQDDESCTIEFVVKDDGIGISSEQQARLFTSFEQGDGGIARKFGGTGLGLAICKKLTDLMGGSIRVESAPHQGSSFIVHLPLIPISNNANSPKLDKNLLRQQSPRILIIDHSSEIRQQLESLLHEYGIAVSSAASGFIAMEMIEQSIREKDPYTIIFVEWRLPDMDGIETAKRIKELFGKQTVAILSSAAEWNLIEPAATDAGITRFLSKPLFPSNVINIINEILGGPPPIKKFDSTPLTPRLEGLSILLVEDMPINREILQAMLDDTGVIIDNAENGVIAVEKFSTSSQDYDLILMDIQMPEMDGYEATRKIRELDIPLAKKIPIIAMTANAFKEDIEKCLNAGMNDHISKPVDEQKIFEKLNSYLQPVRAAKAKKAPPSVGYDDADLSSYLPYIDIAEALSRLRNNQKLYKTMLKSFKDNTLFADLTAALGRNNLKDAQSLNHTLKGVANNLSLKEVFAQCDAIETALKYKRDTSEQMTLLKTSLDITQDLIDKLLIVFDMEA